MHVHRPSSSPLAAPARRVLLAAAAVGILGALAGCGSDAAPATTSVASTAPVITATPTTPVPVTTPPVATTATTAATTTSPGTLPSTLPSPSTSAATSTTVARGAALVLRDNSVGDAVFGADPDQVVAYVTSILGAPTADSGWVDPTTTFGVCPGTEVRGVSFGDLTLLFSDESTVTSGRRHFFTYEFGPAFGPSIDPSGPRTATGIGIGSSVDDLIAAYPDIVINPSDGSAPATFFVSDDLGGRLSGDSGEDAVTVIHGGRPCGE